MISLRLSEQEEKLIKNYAKVNKISVSKLIRDFVLEKIEDELDLHSYDTALKEHKNKPGDISLVEMMEKLGDEKVSS